MRLYKYEGFYIETIEDAPGRFKAVIRRVGGGTVRIAVPPSREFPSITTPLYPSADDAIAEAKAAIIAGGIV